MSYVTTQDGVDIFYKDWGPKDAQPIVFHHGWPLTADDWDNQMLFFLKHGYRVVAHDQFVIDVNFCAVIGEQVELVFSRLIHSEPSLVIHAEPLCAAGDIR